MTQLWLSELHQTVLDNMVHVLWMDGVKEMTQLWLSELHQTVLDNMVHVLWMDRVKEMTQLWLSETVLDNMVCTLDGWSERDDTVVVVRTTPDSTHGSCTLDG